MINNEIVIKMVEPYLKDNQIFEKDFNEIFKMLSEDEKYDVRELLDERDIEIERCEGEKVEDNSSDFDNEEVIDEPNEDLGIEAKKDDWFKILYSNAIFAKDDEILDEKLITNQCRSNEELCILAQQGNELALERLCINNKGLVAKCVSQIEKHRRTRSLQFDDLFQAGMIGLISAVAKFDSSLGTKFTTYATWWIEQKIRREIDDFENIIRVPVHMLELIRKVYKFDSIFVSRGLSFSERIDLITRELGISKEKVRQCIFIKSTILSNSSLDVPIGDEGDTSIIEMISSNCIPTPEQVLSEKSIHDIVMDSLSILKEKEREIIIYRFGLDGGGSRTLEQIGIKYGVTRERIRQIEAKALKKLKKGNKPQTKELSNLYKYKI